MLERRKLNVPAVLAAQLTRTGLSLSRELMGPVWLCFPVWLICRCSLHPKLDFKSRRHAVEGLAIDAEDFGGALSVATGCVENVENVAPLQLIQAWQSGKEVGKIVS